MCRSIRIARGRSFARSGRIASTTSRRPCGGSASRTTREDPARGLVVPVVQDAREQVGVRARRQRVEEVAFDALRPLAEQLARGGDRAGRSTSVAAQRRARRGSRQQDAAPAADVDQAVEGAEVVGGDDRARLRLRAARHRGLERRVVVRVGVEVGEERRAVHALERGPARAHGLEQALGGVVVDLAAHARGAGERLELLADRRQREAPVALLDDVLEREPAQDARERGGVGADRLGELGAGARAVGEARATPSSAAT